MPEGHCSSGAAWLPWPVPVWSSCEMLKEGQQGSPPGQPTRAATLHPPSARCHACWPSACMLQLDPGSGEQGSFSRCHWMSCDPKSSGGGGLWLTWSFPQPGELQQEAGSQLDFQLLVTPAWQDLQVRSVLGCLSNSADRVEAVMCLYPRLVDKDNLWMVLYALKVRNVGRSRHHCGT